MKFGGEMGERDELLDVLKEHRDDRENALKTRREREGRRRRTKEHIGLEIKLQAMKQSVSAKKSE